LAYETLPWVTAAAIMSGGAPDWRVLLVALLYGLGAHGIMTLNDFKAIEGDRRMGVLSLPVQLGAERAGLVACIFMAAPQVLVIGLLFAWDAPWHAAAVAVSLLVQLGLMRRMLRDPRGLAPWYNGTGVLLYVIGMLISAFALAALTGGVA
jgi:chlorophyll synthase